MASKRQIPPLNPHTHRALYKGIAQPFFELPSGQMHEANNT